MQLSIPLGTYRKMLPFSNREKDNMHLSTELEVKISQQLRRLNLERFPKNRLCQKGVGAF